MASRRYRQPDSPDEGLCSRSYVIVSDGLELPGTRRPGDIRGCVERHAVVPDGNIVLGPLEADLEVMILGDVSKKIVE